MKEKLRRSGLKIMAGLLAMLNSLAYLVILAVINGSLGTLLAMGVSVFGSLAVAKYLGENILLSYPLLITFCVLCGVFRGLLRYFEQYSNHYIAFKLLAVLRDKIFTCLRRLCPAKLETKKKGSIIAMLTSDIETLEVFYAHTISPIGIAVVVCTFCFLFIGFMSSFYLALLALLAYLTIGIVLPLLASNAMKKPGVLYRNEFSSFNAYFLDSIKGVKDIVLNNGEDSRKAEVNRRSDKLLEQTKTIKRKTALTSSLTELFIAVFMILALLLGILLTIYQNLTLGSLIIGLVTFYSSFGPVIALANLPSNLNQTFASGERVLSLFEEKPLVDPITNKNNFDFESLTIENLSFHYPDSDEGVLKDVSLHAKEGEIIGIVGDSGSGKSTILKLLLRFFEKENGNIYYNNLPIEEINTDSLLDNVTMVSQSTYLFNDTIKENLLIAKQDATDEEIKEACKKASIDTFIESLPKGYDTVINNIDTNVSAGEKQRIGLARAFLRQSKLVLLDEPTSNVDSMNEGIILKAILQQKKNHTFILVSHRESTVAICDRIYHIENGVLKESQEK